MARRANRESPSDGCERRTYTDLVLEGIALRHQITVLKRSGTRRPYFCWWDRLFWMLLSWLWSGWRGSLMIVQSQTVLRWRRQGRSVVWRYGLRSHWRGGRPRVSRELRGLIKRMARENFLWGAPRIHGELLMLGFKLSQATVSRYLPPPGRRRGQSWRTFLRNQASAFELGQYRQQHDDEPRLSLRPAAQSVHPTLTLARPPDALGSVGHRDGPIPKVYRLDTVVGYRLSARVSRHPTTVAMRPPQHQARASPQTPFARQSKCRTRF